MDNYEHLFESADVVAEILQKASNVKILATSRETLKLQGETALKITGMSFPGLETSADLRSHDAVELMLHSIQRVRPRFDPEADELKHLAHVCRLVEGMPLAIELAAAWIDVLSPKELAGEIQRGLDILTSEIRDLPERHRSMRAVFDQSWSLLNQTEREVVMRLSVFRSGFTREAAELVAGASIQILAGLVNKSFLRHDPTSNRFEIHELLRQYAQEQLEEKSGDRVSAQDAHATYFANFMQQRWENLKDRRQKVALTEIDADLENIRTAWRYYVNQANATQMQMFVNSFWLVYWVRGWNHAADELFAEAVEALNVGSGNDESESVKAQALGYQGYFKTWMGFADQGYQLAKKGVAILEQLNHPVELGLALGSLNLAADFLTRYEEAEIAARKMLEIATQQEDQWLRALSLYKLSVANEIEHDLADTLDLAETSLELFEELGEEIISIWTLLTLGHISVSLGEHIKAKELYLRCLRSSEAVGYRWATENSYKYLGHLALSLNETEEAKTNLLKSLKIADEIGAGRDKANLLYDLARVRVAEDRLEQAVELLAVVLQHPASKLHRLGGGSIRDRVQELLGSLKADLSTEAYGAALERGNAQSFDEIVLDLLAKI